MVTDLDSPDWKALSRSGGPRLKSGNPMTHTCGREAATTARGTWLNLAQLAAAGLVVAVRSFEPLYARTFTRE
jgi:hypothetical protein